MTAFNVDRYFRERGEQGDIYVFWESSVGRRGGKREMGEGRRRYLL